MITLADIFEALTHIRPEGGQQEITKAVVDSRQVIPDALFIAVPGKQKDGHDFVGTAFEHGAQVAIIQNDLSGDFSTISLREELENKNPVLPDTPLCLLVDDSVEALQQIAHFWRRKCKARIIGITGSVGKTTTKELTAKVLSQRHHTLKNPGNLNNEIGLPLTMLQLTKQHSFAVLEMGFYVPGEILFLCDISLPHVGVVTNIGTVHAERAGTQNNITQGKAELVQALPEAPNGVAVLNYDDVRVREMAEKTKARIFYYGLDAQADLWADEIEGLGLDGIRFRLHYQNETLHLRVPLIGRHSVHTVLRAASVGLIEGLSWQEIIEGLRSEQTQLRLVAVHATSGALLLDDTYNASPQSSLAALNLLDELQGNKIAVLGDMLELGIYEARGHEMVGMRAAEVVDELVTVGELAKMISSAAIKAGFNPDLITELSNSQQAIEYLESKLAEHDVVLVKGSRGVRMDIIIENLEDRK